MEETVIANTRQPSVDNQKAFLIVSGVALFVIGGSIGVYYLLKKKKEEEKHPGETTVPESAKTKRPGGFACISKNYPLKYGSCHPHVGILQSYLKKMYKARLGRAGANKDGVDGKFGKATKDAAIKYLGKAIFTPKDIIGIKAALKFTSR